MSTALRAATARLEAAGIDGAGLDARLLLAHAMGVGQAALLRDREAAAPDAFWPLVERRAAREPMAFILGRQGFWTLDLMVSAATLIPRPDSETLIEALLAARPHRGAVRRVLDCGTGTGCLLLAALSEYPEAWGLGIDRAPGAAMLARANAGLTGLAGRASFAVADWATPIDGRFDAVLSNPPYIPSADIAGLMPEVAAFEPGLALDGGADGLAAYRALMGSLARLLAPGGLAVFEVGVGQAGDVAEIGDAAGFRCATRADLGGVERAVLMEKKVGIGDAGH